MEVYEVEIETINQHFEADELTVSIVKANELLSRHPNQFDVCHFCGALFIDAGTGLDDKEVITQGIQLLEQLLVDHPDLAIEVFITVEYNLSNGYCSMAALFFRAGQYNESRDARQRQKSLLHHVLLNKKYLSNGMAARAITNYANVLDQLDRTIEAVDHFYDCLKIKPNHAVAKANCGVALQRLVPIASPRQRAIVYEAWRLLFEANSDPVQLTHLAGAYALPYFQRQLAVLEAYINQHEEGGIGALQDWSLKECPRHTNWSPQLLFQEWRDQHLLLSISYGRGKCPSNYRDDVFFRQMIMPLTKADDHYFQNLSHMLNQIKEDYALARYFYHLAEAENQDIKQINKITLYGEVWDYAEFGLRPGLLKSSISTAVDILDKIAVFLNTYLNLGFPVKRVTFENIWFDGLKKDKKILNPIIENLLKNNQHLRGLQDLSLDRVTKEYPGPLNDIRNAVTHRHIALYWLPIKKEVINGESYSLGQFRELTLQNLRSTKAAQTQS